MKSLITLIAVACLVGAAFAEQPNPPPTPGPENQKLAVWYGEWTYSGEIHPTPLGPASKFTGRMTGRPVLNGFAAEFIYNERSSAGETESRELCWYDPATKNYAYVYLGNDGYVEQGPFTMSGEVCTWEAKCVAGGTPFKMKGTETMAPDGMTLTRKADISIDGKTWLPFLASKFTKVKVSP
jgi:hypothetical protein